MPSAVMWQDETAPLEQRARTYLDINCAHCHSPGRRSRHLGIIPRRQHPSRPRVRNLQVTRSLQAQVPVACLLTSIPGQPEDSILVYRMGSTDPASMMPELGRSLSHSEGADLIAEWIKTLDGDC